jgi:predicted RNA binding protein YcfA (HicA-like mRNA interferase family)
MLERRGFFPVAVPKHGGRALKKGTVLRILAVIEASLNR